MKKYILVLIGLIFLGNAQILPADYSTITNKDEMVLINEDQEVAMGKRLSRSVEKQFKLVEDEKLQKRVDKIGQKLAAISERKYLVFHFAVLKGDDVNAFSLPGGYVYIFEGLIKKIKSDDELAAVIGHEIGHISGRHNIKRLQGALGSSLLLVLSGLSSGNGNTQAESGRAINELVMESSREAEITADILSVKEIMDKAPIKPYAYYKTHPYLSQRIAIVKEEIHGKMDFIDYINKP